MAQSFQNGVQRGSLCNSCASGTDNTFTITDIKTVTDNTSTTGDETVTIDSNGVSDSTCISSSNKTSTINTSKSSYVWTEADTAELISWRIRNRALFTGRRNAAQRGFEEFVRLRGLSGKIEPIKVKRKWENLKQRYKELKTPGETTEGAATPATSWKWYRAMDEALRVLPPYGSRPLLIDSSGTKLVLKSPPAFLRKTPVSGIPVKRRKEPEWASMLKGMVEREEEKEKVFLEREERREWEALEREEKKESERVDREERRERERMEREERWEIERREWDERRETESREREERREREWIERQERWEKERREWEERRETENREKEEKREKEWMERQERWERERREWEEKRETENREREQRREKENREREERWQKENQARDDKLMEVLKLLAEKK